MTKQNPLAYKAHLENTILSFDAVAKLLYDTADKLRDKTPETVTEREGLEISMVVIQVHDLFCNMLKGYAIALEDQAMEAESQEYGYNPGVELSDDEFLRKLGIDPRNIQ